MRATPAALLSIIVLLAVAACSSSERAAAPGGEPPAATSPAPAAASVPAAMPAPAGTPALAGTTWRLMEFRSADDAIGVIKPEDPEKYTMTLGADGQASLQLNCNRATGHWAATAAGADSGTFSLGPLAMTNALCPPPSMDERVGRDAQFVRGYLLKDGRLYLSLMADGGTYAWEPHAAAP